MLCVPGLKIRALRQSCSVRDPSALSHQEHFPRTPQHRIVVHLSLPLSKSGWNLSQKSAVKEITRESRGFTDEACFK